MAAWHVHKQYSCIKAHYRITKFYLTTSFIDILNRSVQRLANVTVAEALSHVLSIEHLLEQPYNGRAGRGWIATAGDQCWFGRFRDLMIG
jgi:hypothetical protein